MKRLSESSGGSTKKKFGVAKVEETSTNHISDLFVSWIQERFRVAKFRKVRMDPSQNDLRLVKVIQPSKKETHLINHFGRGHVLWRVSFALQKISK